MHYSRNAARKTPQRVLHVGNILNNGYLNAKFLRRRGLAADALTVDYKHVQAQPEWEEVYLRQTVAEFDPDWSSVDLGGYQRPEWFFDVWQRELPQLAAWLDSRFGPSLASSGEELHEVDSGFVGDGGPRLGVWGKQIARAQWLLAWSAKKMGLARPLCSLATPPAPKQETWDHLLAEFANRYPTRQPTLQLADIMEYLPRSQAHAPVFRHYPLIHAYSLDPICAMLGTPGTPFICHEHGTMREFPFEDSARGRLYALALQKAEKVIITNADCNRSAESLALTNHVFIPHPVDEELYRPQPSQLRARLQQEHQCDWIFVAPARHHWKHCPAGLENSWFKRNDILIRGLARVFKNRPQLRALVVFFEWGQEVALSKTLIAELGFADRVRWEPIRSKPVIRDFYNAADIVYDQFNDGIGTFGTVVPEALACAKPVMLNYKSELHHWCYPELPPVLNAPDEETVERHSLELLSNEGYRHELGERGRHWFLRYHSSRLVSDRLLEVYREVSENCGWGWKI